MKKFIETTLAILIIFIVGVSIIAAINYGAYWLYNQYKSAEFSEKFREQHCLDEGGVWDEYQRCQSHYEYCLWKVRNTFQDLTDTVGVSQNNADAISGNMRLEIDRCLQIKPLTNI